MLNRYDHSEIRQIWEQENVLLIWLRIELVFLKYLRGIEVDLPETFQSEWMESIRDIENKRHHDLAAFVEWAEKFLFDRIGGESRYIHFGLTSSDIVDTGFSLMVRRSNEVIAQEICRVTDLLDGLSCQYADLPFVGRTHGQSAEIMPLGQKFVAYSRAIKFCLPSMEYFGKLSGSVGDSKYFNPDIEKKVLTELELELCPVVDGQIIHRGVFAKYLNEWAILASVIAKIATDIRLLSQTGIAEIQESFGSQQIGSSSMPHKRNPVLSENICGLARTIRGYQVAAMQNIELWNERDISHSGAERIIFPDAAVLLGFMLVRLGNILEKLSVNEDTIKRHVQEQQVHLQTQPKMLELIEKGMSRTEAHASLK